MPVLPDLDNIIFFTITAIVLIVVPGPAILFIVANSIRSGTRSGLVSVLGIGLGEIVHVVGAALGLSALLMTSAQLFMLVKYIGAGYLIFLGLKSIFQKSNKTTLDNIETKSSLKKVFVDGIVVSVFNPKTAIFFLAFLPQFINEEKGGTTSQLLFLGMLFLMIAMTSDSIYAILSGKISGLLSRSERFNKTRNQMVGIIYILLGALTLLAERPVSKTQ